MATVGYIIGSISSKSINRKLVNGLIAAALKSEANEEQPLEFSEIVISDLPMYNYDLDKNYPPQAVRLKEQIRACDALLIATPEYNRSIPGVLKNAIDWASRPYGDNAFRGRPVGMIGASVGAIGTANAQQHLRNILGYLDAPTMGQPEGYIHFTKDRFSEDGTAIDPDTQKFLANWTNVFRDWIENFAPVRTGVAGTSREILSLT